MVELVAPTKREFLEAQMIMLKNDYFARSKLLQQQLDAEIAREQGGTP